jgi:hypothetical protein
MIRMKSMSESGFAGLEDEQDKERSGFTGLED